jgi:hypothetical protein
MVQDWAKTSGKAPDLNYLWWVTYATMPACSTPHAVCLRLIKPERSPFNRLIIEMCERSANGIL